MKTLKIFFLLILAVTVFGQVKNPTPSAGGEGNFDVYYRQYTEQKEYVITFTDVDSTDLVSGLTSDVFDWSDICDDVADAPNFRYAYTTTSANDTLMCLVDAYDPLTGNFNTIDSLGGITIYSTTNGGTTTYGTVSLSTNGYSPYVRLKIKRPGANNNQADNGTFEISIFGRPVNQTRWPY